MERWQLESPVGHLDRPDHGAEARVSRAQVLRRGAAVVGAVAGLGLVDAGAAFGQAGSDPKPIPGGFDQNFTPVPSNPFIHVLPPAIGFEMSTITDFNGVVAAAEIQGTARGSDGTTYTFDTDMRFMRGVYVDTGGRVRDASFGFI